MTTKVKTIRDGRDMLSEMEETASHPDRASAVDERLDVALRESCPASDPPASGRME
ncbi:hypothetical protein [Rhizobium sp. Root708]|uniref:hypothetical protein n=1 Tax=Rhizobium sp. Root708 TaxID=1736592 RepID=UPI000A55DF2D|nr:hypothetical protein [Rhizobium sp. Root708]